ncbi:hypothetical protein M422DRAFT_50616 [Sphaerobolus stellatus SS14]|uniref:Uncharacterized protein n=1 Tax=Sphaerobolus stellatus (strain SS14) TaxID=990650 RepID=A0A0C9VI11_SPHS4|nr:hypothetical protein M422DRAFT_50616 [Sphaerobolus stellatus SS14]
MTKPKNIQTEANSDFFNSPRRITGIRKSYRGFEWCRKPTQPSSFIEPPAPSQRALPIPKTPSSSSSFHLLKTPVKVSKPSPWKYAVSPWRNIKLEGIKIEGLKRPRESLESDIESSPHRPQKRTRTSKDGLNDAVAHQQQRRKEKRLIVLKPTTFEKEVIRLLISIDSQLKEISRKSRE